MLLNKTACLLPNKRVFNRCFVPALNDTNVDTMKEGINLVGRWYSRKEAKKTAKITQTTTDKVATNHASPYENKARYNDFPYGSGGYFGLFMVMGPIIIGVGGTLACLGFFAGIFYIDNYDFPWIFLWATLAWNIFWCNARSVLLRIISGNTSKRMILDRQAQTIIVTQALDQATLNEHGHAVFPFSEVEAYSSIQASGNASALTSQYVAFMALKNQALYPEVYTNLPVPINPKNDRNCRQAWEYVLAFMDNTQPLPDVPEFEPYRHLDPLTAEFDKKNNRPAKYWQLMAFEQQSKIANEFNDAAKVFNFNRAYSNARYANKVITKPWEQWPIDDSIFIKRQQTPEWKKQLKIILRQLAFSI